MIKLALQFSIKQTAPDLQFRRLLLAAPNELYTSYSKYLKYIITALTFYDEIQFHVENNVPSLAGFLHFARVLYDENDDINLILPLYILNLLIYLSHGYYRNGSFYMITHLTRLTAFECICLNRRMNFAILVISLY